MRTPTTMEGPNPPINFNRSPKADATTWAAAHAAAVTKLKSEIESNESSRAENNSFWDRHASTVYGNLAGITRVVVNVLKLLANTFVGSALLLASSFLNCCSEIESRANFRVRGVEGFKGAKDNIVNIIKGIVHAVPVFGQISILSSLLTNLKNELNVVKNDLAEASTTNDA